MFQTCLTVLGFKFAIREEALGRADFVECVCPARDR
jgi:hypothetical protein